MRWRPPAKGRAAGAGSPATRVLPPARADRVIVLKRRTTPLPADLAARFPHVAEGPVLTLAVQRAGRDGKAQQDPGDRRVHA